MAIGIFHAGQVTARINTLEIWRTELRSDLDKWRTEIHNEMESGFKRLDSLIKNFNNESKR